MSALPIPFGGRVFSAKATFRKKSRATSADVPGQLPAVKGGRPEVAQGPQGWRERSSVLLPSNVHADSVREESLDR